eukprot:1843028-Pleurochrysis_carterae.AAC.1
MAPSPLASAPTGPAMSETAASPARRTASSAAASTQADGTRVAATTARMMRCSAEWRCPAARAPASAHAAASAMIPRSAGVHLAMEWSAACCRVAPSAHPGTGGAQSSPGRISLLGANKASASSMLGGRSAPACSSPSHTALARAARSAPAAARATGSEPPVKRAKRAASAEAQTKKCASPPGCAGSHPRASVSAPRCDASASPTASRKKAHARFNSGTRCALMPSAAAISVITASYSRLAESARTRASPYQCTTAQRGVSSWRARHSGCRMSVSWTATSAGAYAPCAAWEPARTAPTAANASLKSSTRRAPARVSASRMTPRPTSKSSFAVMWSSARPGTSAVGARHHNP